MSERDSYRSDYSESDHHSGSSESEVKVKAVHQITHDGQTIKPGEIFMAPESLRDELKATGAVEDVEDDDKKPVTALKPVLAGPVAPLTPEQSKQAADEKRRAQAERAKGTNKEGKRYNSLEDEAADGLSGDLPHGDRRSLSGNAEPSGTAPKGGFITNDRDRDGVVRKGGGAIADNPK